MPVDKREAKKEFKTRKTPVGVYLIRCLPTGQAWAGGSDHLDTVRNSVWFQLRSGIHRTKALQAAWNQYGESAFDFSVAEQIEDDIPALALKDTLAGRRRHWERELSALPV